jgi:hypothetical protein
MAKYSLKKLRRYVSAETTQIEITLCVNAPDVGHNYLNMPKALHNSYLRMVKGMAEANIIELLDIALPSLKFEIKHVMVAEKLALVHLYDRPNSEKVREIKQAIALTNFCSEVANRAVKDAYEIVRELYTAMVSRS